MENEFITKRRLIIVLVTVTVLVFVGLVWLIARLQPWEFLGIQSSTSTSRAPLLQNCAYPVSYWKEHPELFPPHVIIGGVVYKERELEALLGDNSQDIGQQIKTQLAVAFLNSLAGADQSLIETTIFEAYGWLVKHPNGSPITNAESEEGQRLFNLLEAYNLGSGGVAPCEAVSAFTKTATPTGTKIMPTGTLTSQTSTPTETGTSTLMITVSATVFNPSDTPVPTTARPGAPSWTPTQVSPAGPSKTPTTQAPSPTRTTAPTFTHTPQPTFTVTLPPTFTPTPSLPPTLPPTDTPGPTLPPDSIP